MQLPLSMPHLIEHRCLTIESRQIHRIDYFIVRTDPDKITPLKSEAQSKEYLSQPADGGQ